MSSKIRVKAGNVEIGGGAPVSIQSMINIPSTDIEGSVRQAKELEQAGCEIIRIAIPDMSAIKLIEAIKKEVKAPIVADIHFDYRLAIEAVNAGIDKVRINPGNIGSDDRVREVVRACRSRSIPIRIGVNSGSLEKNILAKYGSPTAEALCESALFHASLLEKFDFYDIVLSMKSSTVGTMIKAYELASEKCDYPLHLGVTEAEEVYAARDILKAIDVDTSGVKFISCPTCGRTRIDLISIANEAQKRLADCNKSITVAVMGCVVNGPGEAREADIGIAGGDGVGLVFKKGEIIRKVSEDMLLDTLMEEIGKL